MSGPSLSAEDGKSLALSNTRFGVLMATIDWCSAASINNYKTIPQRFPRGLRPGGAGPTFGLGVLVVAR
jgi:hypothetical protein